MKITNYRSIDKAGSSLVASFDVEFAPLTVRGLKLFCKDDGGMFISEPSESYTDREGKKQFKKHVIITDELVKARIESAAKEIWRSKGGEQHSADAIDDDGPF